MTKENDNLFGESLEETLIIGSVGKKSLVNINRKFDQAKLAQIEERSHLLKKYMEMKNRVETWERGMIHNKKIIGFCLAVAGFLGYLAGEYFEYFWLKLPKINIRFWSSLSCGFFTLVFCQLYDLGRLNLLVSTGRLGGEEINKKILEILRPKQDGKVVLSEILEKIGKKANPNIVTAKMDLMGFQRFGRLKCWKAEFVCTKTDKEKLVEILSKGLIKSNEEKLTTKEIMESLNILEGKTLTIETLNLLGFEKSRDKFKRFWKAEFVKTEPVLEEIEIETKIKEILPAQI